MSRSTHSNVKQPRRHNTPHRSSRTKFRSVLATQDYDSLVSYAPSRLTRRVVN